MYFGGEMFSLRAGAGNMTIDEIKEGVAYAHSRGVRCHLALNVYAHNEDIEPLQAYIEERKKINAQDGHEKALFLSSQRKRISVRTVENLVKKYSQSAVPLKHITPHKLRSTFGTALYQETSDIYLVADVLGHTDVNTTRKHYADIDDERKRMARNKVQLREKIDK